MAKRLFVACGVGLWMLGAGCAAASAAEKDCDWCKVVCPDRVAAGQSFQVKVTLKRALKGDENLSLHMHHTKTDGKWGGMYEWRPSQTPAVGTPAVFSFTAKADRPAKALNPMLFVAPKGDFNKLVRKLDLPPIAYEAAKLSAAEAAKKKAREDAVRRPASVTFKKSWMKISSAPGVVEKGGKVKVTVKYRIDKSDCWGDGLTLRLTPLGPWIDNPDGAVNKSRTHVFVHGFWPQSKANLVAGEGTVEFDYTCETTYPYCEVGFMAQFVGPDGQTFPWQVRGGSVAIVPETKGFRLEATAPGGIFTYDEDVTLRVFGNAGAGPVRLVVTATDGSTAFDGTVAVKDGFLTVPRLKCRGCFLAEATVGTTTRSCFFATIPDVKKVLGGKRPPFGCTNLREANAIAAADRIGFRYCRLFTGWAGLQPARDVWTLDGLDRQIDDIRAAGIEPWILLTGAPEWVMPEGIHSPGFEPYPFDAAAWKESATCLARHYKGRIWGFEWLNEIVQGSKTKTPVEDYLKFCRIGTAAVKAVDPKMKIQLAGGLWPRNFRLDLLRAGVGEAIDVLPIHYGAFESVAQARGDFAAGGGTHVWDNESARGYSVWGMEPRKALFDSMGQCLFVMRQWPGELVAGAEAIVYFGGEANAAGNWTYLLDAHTPRPVAATLAVLGAKLGDAKPVGSAMLGANALAYHFTRKDGRALAFVMTMNEKDAAATVKVPVGNVTRVVATDCQGNARALAAEGGFVTVEARPMPVILEGFDGTELAKLKSPEELLRERSAAMLAKPELQGNLVKNGGFEQGRGKPDGWWCAGTKLAALPDDLPGYSGQCLEMRDNTGYASAGQEFKLPAAGIRYLYSAWVWTGGMYCGSNAAVLDGSGKGRNYSIPSCFCAPTDTKGWQYLTKVLDAVPGAVKGSVSPVGQLPHGRTKGWARYDNIRVTAYEDTDFSADARKASGPVSVDGDLSDWDFDDPIPLLCENQVGGVRGGYVWSRENLSGIAQFKWTADGLYFAAKVHDDVHATKADASAAEGDALTVALHPGNRVPGTDAQAMELILSDRSPGGGSGKYTLYRPAAHCGGGKSGQLAKDSSVYEIAVRRTGSEIAYELMIPWSELKGVMPQAGAKLGLSLRLSDLDGEAFGRINWGMGLDPAWAPTAFGVLTLIN